MHSYCTAIDRARVPLNPPVNDIVQASRTDSHSAMLPRKAVRGTDAARMRCIPAATHQSALSAPCVPRGRAARCHAALSESDSISVTAISESEPQSVQPVSASDTFKFGASMVQGARPTMEDVLRVEHGLPAGFSFAGVACTQQAIVRHTHLNPHKCHSYIHNNCHMGKRWLTAGPCSNLAGQHDERHGSQPQAAYMRGPVAAMIEAGRVDRWRVTCLASMLVWV